MGASTGKFTAFNSDGSVKFTYTAGSAVSSSAAIASDGTIYFGCDDGCLYALKSTGALKWKFSTSPASAVRSSPAIGTDGTVYFGATGGYFYAVYSGGTQRWRASTDGGVYSSPAIAADGSIYFGCRDDKLYCLNSNGAVKWKYTTGSYVDSCPAIDSNGTVYVGSNDSSVYAVNPDGSLLWSDSLGSPVLSSPAVGVSSSLYVLTYDGWIRSFIQDTTPPLLPTVIDDGQWSTSSTTLHASWSSSDPESGIADYQYAIGTSPGAQDVAPFTDAGLATQVTRTDLTLTNGATYYFAVTAVNGAGLTSAVGVSDGIRIDFTPPSTPAVTDDGAYSSSLTTLHAIWSSSDPVSGIADYQYAIGTSPGAQDVAPFTDAGLATQVTRTNLTLTNGATYYFAVTAVNGAGLKSAVGVSDGIRIDLTPPSTPAVTDDGAYSTSLTTLHAIWSLSDPVSGIADYQYAIGTTPGAQDVVPFTNAGQATQVTRTDLTLTNGATYYFAVTAVNGAGLKSAVGVSDGIRIDVNPPSTPAVTDDGSYSTSLTTLHAIWSSSDAESGIAGYQYAIGTTPGAQDVVPFTNAGQATQVTRTDLSLVNGQNYYFTVLATNGAGSSASPASPTAFSWTPHRLAYRW